MDILQEQYSAFMESVCTTLGCTDALPALNEGFNAFCEAVDDNMVKLVAYLNQPATKQIRDAEGYPVTTHKAFNYFEDATIKEGVWGVHFTNLDAYYKIMSRGFSRGTANLDKLAYTGHSTTGRKKDGWLFALPIDSDYLKEYDLGYGDCGFLIKTDGVLANHLGDGDKEILFRGKDVSVMIPFQYDEEYDKWITEVDDVDYSSIIEIIAKYATG